MSDTRNETLKALTPFKLEILTDEALSTGSDRISDPSTINAIIRNTTQTFITEAEPYTCYLDLFQTRNLHLASSALASYSPHPKCGVLVFRDHTPPHTSPPPPLTLTTTHSTTHITTLPHTLPHALPETLHTLPHTLPHTPPHIHYHTRHHTHYAHTHTHTHTHTHSHINTTTHTGQQIPQAQYTPQHVHAAFEVYIILLQMCAATCWSLLQKAPFGFNLSRFVACWNCVQLHVGAL